MDAQQPGPDARPDQGGSSRTGGGSAVNLQGTLFDELPEQDRPGGHAPGIGYRGPTACSAAGITYRQLDYWARTGLVEPTVREASGSGSQRLYSFRDILVLRVVKKLLDAGVSLPNIRTAIGTLRDRGAEDLAQLTLISDGTTVYECTSTDEMVDLLQGGQAVFAIAVGRQVRDVEGTLAQLPGERASRDAEAAGAQVVEADELASRRKRRTSA
ncbi:MAG: MerR family transcriptional regulator [Mycobacteriales bacterium]